MHPYRDFKIKQYANEVQNFLHLMQTVHANLGITAILKKNEFNSMKNESKDLEFIWSVEFKFVCFSLESQFDVQRLKVK